MKKIMTTSNNFQKLDVGCRELSKGSSEDESFCEWPTRPRLSAVRAGRVQRGKVVHIKSKRDLY